MSQSPIDDFSDQATLSYKQGWRALNRLLHEDRSFSGHERHCAFLNTGGETARFADVSAVTGFDFADDGRGLATCDWDFDGDLDVWTTNRTAPRVRLLKNAAGHGTHFVAFKLQGDGITTNRDAIGARLELHLEGSASPKRIRTLHAGEGFLSQSSSWLHFGLGDAGAIDKLTVHWPGGSSQDFSGISPGHFYLIKQDAPNAELFNPPTSRAALVSSEQSVFPIGESARIIVPIGLPLPQIDTVQSDGSKEAHTFSTQAPTIINIWSSTCAPCIAELTEWSTHRDKLLARGTHVITFSTDHLAGETDAAATARALSKTGSAFPNFKISEASLSALDDLQRSVLDRWKPLPVPSSFLIDQNGEVVAIYKGKVSVDQLIRDLPLTAATADQRRDAAIPFPGRWVAGAGSADPKRVASMMLDHNRIKAGSDYLDRCAERLESRPELTNQRRNLGDIYFMSAMLKSSDPQRHDETLNHLKRARDLIPDDIRIRQELGKQFLAANKQQEALREFTAASKLNPGNFELRKEIALMHFRLGNYAASHDLLSELVTDRPQEGLLHYHLANAQIRTGNISEAIAGYRKALSLSPNTLEAANNLAWILAAHPDQNLRSADEALALAERLCSITKQEHVPFLDTLSIALANSGDYKRAIEVAGKAVALYPEERAADADPIRARIKLYEGGKPYRETVWQ